MIRIGFLLLLACAGARADDSNVVNERLTASAAAMEAHWRVDCTATLRALATPIASQARIRHDALAEALLKCRYIYQVPGGGSVRACPDYAALQQAWNTADDAALKAELQRSEDCP